MAILNINELLEDVQQQAQYRVVRYLQNKYLRTEGAENEYSAALELIDARQVAERIARGQ